MVLDTPTYQDTVPDHLRTLGQLRATGLRPGNAAVPAAWWVQAFAGDHWRTELYDVRLAVSLVPRPALPVAGSEPAGIEPVVMTIVTWTKPVRRRVEGRFTETGLHTQVRVHVSVDGVRTACGSDIPEHATVKAETVEWHLHTNCYNCAYRLWPSYAPPGYIRPANRGDFPIRRV